MNRRNFISKSALAGAGLFMFSDLKLQAESLIPLASKSFDYQVNKDGSFDIKIDNQIWMKSCYPAIDHQSIRPLSVKIDKLNSKTQIIYLFETGTLTVVLSNEAGQFKISSSIEGFSVAPHWVYPLANAEVVQGNRFFRHGLGFGGPNGLFNIPKSTRNHDLIKLTEQAWSYDSYLNMALVDSNDAALVWGAFQHDRFLQRSTIYNKTNRLGLVDYRPAADEVTLLETGFGTENIPLNNKKLDLPEIIFFSGTNLYSTLEKFIVSLATVMNIKPNKKPSYHWDSWYEYYEDFDEAKLDATLKGFKEMNPPPRLDGILIDAGWCPMGDWLEADKRVYPSGLAGAVEKIKNAGFKPGIWIGPFMVSSESKLFKEHPDWILKNTKGEFLLDSEGNKGFVDDVVIKEKRYYLDTSNPEAFEYMRKVCRQFKEWGVSVSKIDFLDWGFKDSTTVKRFSPGKTSVEYFMDVIKMIRQEMGKDCFLIGCISPIAPILGHFDAYRPAYDVSETWEPTGNISNMFQETVNCFYMHDVIWKTDPDMVYLRRNSSLKLSDDETQTLALWSGMLNGVIATSDRLYKIHPFRYDLWKFIEPGINSNKAKLPYIFSDKKQALVAALENKKNSCWTVLIINTKEKEIDESYSLKELTGIDQAYCFNWMITDSEPMGRQTSINCKILPHQSKLIYINSENLAPDKNSKLRS